MKVKFPLVILLLLAGAAGYLLGTENGRVQRDVILVRMGRKPADDAEVTAQSADAEQPAAAEDAAASASAESPESSDSAESSNDDGTS